ncbi:MAG: hypothetical protein DUD34_11730 [Lactobacillus sp.]|nr:MAG: hypothetical protein DUD34_11730 [Lactobacillus sp.]
MRQPAVSPQNISSGIEYSGFEYLIALLIWPGTAGCRTFRPGSKYGSEYSGFEYLIALLIWPGIAGWGTFRPSSKYGSEYSGFEYLIALLIWPGLLVVARFGQVASTGPNILVLNI